MDEKELLETTIQSLETWQDQRWISVPKCMRYVLDNALKLLKKQQEIIDRYQWEDGEPK